MGHSQACRRRVEEEMLKHEDLAQELTRCQERREETQARDLEELSAKRKKAEDSRIKDDQQMKVGERKEEREEMELEEARPDENSKENGGVKRKERDQEEQEGPQGGVEKRGGTPDAFTMYGTSDPCADGRGNAQC